MKRTYKALLFSLDGDDHVSDFKDRATANEVCELLGDMGSKWFFYPIHFVATNKGRMVLTPVGLENLRNKGICTVAKYIRDNQEWISEELL